MMWILAWSIVDGSVIPGNGMQQEFRTKGQMAKWLHLVKGTESLEHLFLVVHCCPFAIDCWHGIGLLIPPNSSPPTVVQLSELSCRCLSS
jgi:hypothetical protein